MKIKNWKRFQHFTDRRPPWIKLYRDLLDDPVWHDLDPVASKMLVMFWLIASETDDGSLPDSKKLCFRLRINEKRLSDTVSRLSEWLVHDDDSAISTRYQADAPETERETERETDINRAHASNATKARPKDAAEVTEYAKSIGFVLDGQYFIDTYEKGGWVYGKGRIPVKDWQACVRTWKKNGFENQNGHVKKDVKVLI